LIERSRTNRGPRDSCRIVGIIIETAMPFIDLNGAEIQLD